MANIKFIDCKKLAIGSIKNGSYWVNGCNLYQDKDKDKTCIYNYKNVSSYSLITSSIERVFKYAEKYGGIIYGSMIYNLGAFKTSINTYDYKTRRNIDISIPFQNNKNKIYDDAGRVISVNQINPIQFPKDINVIFKNPSDQQKFINDYYNDIDNWKNEINDAYDKDGNIAFLMRVGKMPTKKQKYTNDIILPDEPNYINDDKIVVDIFHPEKVSSEQHILTVETKSGTYDPLTNVQFVKFILERITLKDKTQMVFDPKEETIYYIE